MNKCESTLTKDIRISNNKLKLKRYSDIDFEAITLTDLSFREWQIVENIEYWGKVTVDRYVDVTMLVLGHLFNLSKDRMKHIVRDLVHRGWLKRKKNRYLTTTTKWAKIRAFNGIPIPKEVPKDFIS